MRIHLQVRPILAALRSHRAAVTLLVLEIALTMAVLGNLVFIGYGTLERSRTPTGVAESQIGVIQSVGVIGQDNPGTAISNLAVLRNVPGVRDATFGIPPLWARQQSPVFLDATRTQPVAHVYEFFGSQGLGDTLGLHVVSGSHFTETDMPDVMDVFMGKAVAPIPTLLTESLAKRLYPQGNALGSIFYDGSHNLRVIGLVDHLRGEITGSNSDDDSLIYEFRVGTQNLGGCYMIRASNAAQLPGVLRAAVDALQKANPGHVSNKVFTMPEFRQQYFKSDLASGRMLVAIMLILLVVTGLGVSGLASFWVQQRRRQIGMRRALGATRTDILNYFQVENFLIVTGGVLLGAVFAYALNLFLMHRFELDRLPADYLLAGACALWLLGQLAVLGPALRASRVPPVVATRSV